MENSQKDLDIRAKKAKIKRLVKLRGKTLKALSIETAVSYFSLANFIEHRTYTTPAGLIRQYDPPGIRRAISDFLCIPYEDLWYGEGNKILDALIEAEMSRIVRDLIERNISPRRLKP